MSWINSTEGDEATADAIKRSYEVIAKLPPHLERSTSTKGGNKLKNAEPADGTEAKAFRVDAAWDNESSRSLRAQACEQALATLHEKYAMAASYATEAGIPVALLSSCGNSSDPKKAYTAVLGPEDFETGGVGGAILRIIGQLMSNEELAAADSIEGLYSWYEDETIPPEGLAPTPQSSSGNEPQATASVEADDKQAQGNKTERSLRDRKSMIKVEKPSQAKAETDLQVQARCTANRKRPVVVLIRSTEAVQTCMLRDMLKLLNQDRAKFPATLVLGLSTLPQIFISGLPADIPALMQTTSMKLASAHMRMNDLFEGVLFGCKPSLSCVLGEEMMRLLVQQRHLCDDNSVESFMSSVKLATVLHFMREPMSALSTAALSGCRELATVFHFMREPMLALSTAALSGYRETVLKALFFVSPQQLQHHYTKLTEQKAGQEPASATVGEGARKGAQPKAKASVQQQQQAVAIALAEAGAAWATWRLGILWMACVARCTGANTSSHFRLHSLYLSACGSKSANTSSHFRLHSLYLSACGSRSKNILPLSSLITALTKAESKVGVQQLDENDEVLHLLDELQELGNEALQSHEVEGLAVAVDQRSGSAAGRQQFGAESHAVEGLTVDVEQRSGSAAGQQWFGAESHAVEGLTVAVEQRSGSAAGQQ
eukprot:gene23757-9313_t